MKATADQDKEPTRASSRSRVAPLSWPSPCRSLPRSPLADAGCSSPRMKSLEQDALKAQMVIAKSRDGKKRGTMDQLTESPSPAPTPSPTPMEGRGGL